jgi:hypothetical protein
MNISDPQTFNRYTYVQNDPVNFIDPSGLNRELGGRCGNNGRWVEDARGGLVCAEVSDSVTVVGESGPSDSLFGGSVFGRVSEVGTLGGGEWGAAQGGRNPPILTAEQLRERGERRYWTRKCHGDAQAFASRNRKERIEQAHAKVKEQNRLVPTEAQNRSLGYSAGVAMIWGGIKGGPPGAALAGIGSGVLGLGAIAVENGVVRISAMQRATAEVHRQYEQELEEGFKKCREKFGPLF